MSLLPRPIQRLGVVMAAAIALWATGHPAEAYRPRVLRMGFIPSEGIQEVMRNAQPIVGLMRRELGMDVVPFVATDYTGVIEAMRAKKLDIAFFAPGAYVLAERQAKARVILKAVRGGKAVFFSAIITHRGSGIHSLRDLKGKTFAFVDPASLSGSLYPKMMLLNEGLNPERDFKRVIYSGGHDATVLAVLNRQVDAGATFANDNHGGYGAWDEFLKDPAQRAQIEVVAYSKPMPNDNIAVASDLDPALVNRIRGALLRISSSPSGRAQLRKIYHIDGFTEASAAEYAPLRAVFDRIGYRGR